MRRDKSEKRQASERIRNPRVKYCSVDEGIEHVCPALGAHRELDRARQPPLASRLPIRRRRRLPFPPLRQIAPARRRCTSARDRCLGGGSGAGEWRGRGGDNRAGERVPEQRVERVQQRARLAH